MRAYIRIVKDSAALSALTTFLMVFAAFAIFFGSGQSPTVIQSMIGVLAVGTLILITGVAAQAAKTDVACPALD